MADCFKIIIITPENSVWEEGIFINALFNTGLNLLHIRKRGYNITELRNLISSISDDFHPRIVIHNHYELLQDFNLKGIHLPEKLRETATNSQGRIISTSYHNPEDIKSESNCFEYAFLSPIFPSISKQGYQSSLNIQQIKSFLAHPVPFPIIALGGITGSNIMQVHNMGFSGAACLGYIWESRNPVEQFEKLRKAVTGTN